MCPSPVPSTQLPAPTQNAYDTSRMGTDCANTELPPKHAQPPVGHADAAWLLCVYLDSDVHTCVACCHQMAPQCQVCADATMRRRPPGLWRLPIQCTTHHLHTPMAPTNFTRLWHLPASHAFGIYQLYTPMALPAQCTTHQLHTPVLLHQEVGTLDISVHRPLCMQVRETWAEQMKKSTGTCEMAEGEEWTAVWSAANFA